jgi:tRNA 2-thiouridine synthesizing protein A
VDKSQEIIAVPIKADGRWFMHTVDLRGVCCPANFVRAKLALEDFETGERVQILLDDGDAVKNVPRSLREEGHQLLGLKEAPEGHFILELKKGED